MFQFYVFVGFFFPFMLVYSKGSEGDWDLHISVQFTISLVVDG